MYFHEIGKIFMIFVILLSFKVFPNFQKLAQFHGLCVLSKILQNFMIFARFHEVGKIQ